MKKLLVLIFSAIATVSSAQGLENLTDAEREAFRAEVREYLLDNPEVILEAIQVLEERQAMASAENDRRLVEAFSQDLTDDGYSYVAGNPDGAITIVEFLDYRCGYCKRSHPAVQAILESNDDIRLVVKEFPILGADSTMASRAATAILAYQRDSYKTFSDLLMEHNGPINEIVLAELAHEAGADADQMLSQMNDEVVNQIIAKNHGLAQQMQITGTPTFVIGPEMIRGFIPQELMQQMVDDVRANL